MGVNLVTRVRNFYIQQRSFSSSDHDVQDGCVTPGNHRLLRFDFLSYNAGTSDMVIGSPASRPDLFVWSSGHGHYHLKDFNEFLLFNANGALATIGYKQAFCAIDIERISPTASISAQFSDCNSDQGISAGWADVYSSGLACQFIVIDGVPDGDYTLQSTTNAQHVAQEECFADNTIWTGIRIAGNAVTVIDPPWIPEDRIPFNRNNLSVMQVGGRWKVVEGGTHWMIDTETSQAEAQRVLDIINHFKLASMCFVGRPRCGDVRPMMYWLTDTGKAPSGSLAGEDCLSFNPANLTVVEIGGRWKVVEGAHWLLDFGAGQGNAIAALHFIRKYNFNEICFVGRPDPSMTYFKTSKGPHVHIIPLDVRRIDWTIDDPIWRRDQLGLIAQQVRTIRLADQPVGEHVSPFEANGLVITTGEANDKEKQIIRFIERYRLKGLELGAYTELKLNESTDEVDLHIAHFEKPPKVTAFGGRKRLAVVELSDIPRHLELVRLLGDGIDRIVIEADGEALLAEVHYRLKQVTKARKPSKGKRKQ